ncbi:hypothetical protein GCM10017687_21030 [Streptomyces echinatus]|uniref:hypothetical protein n=1 Tax=Streptomyces echinatus TaxID=67293 RepID=UPI003379F8E4
MAELGGHAEVAAAQLVADVMMPGREAVPSVMQMTFAVALAGAEPLLAPGGGTLAVVSTTTGRPVTGLDLLLERLRCASDVGREVHRGTLPV